MDWKKIGKKLLFPSVWVIILCTILSAAALVAVFLKCWEETLVAYIVYVAAFYALTIFCIGCWKIFPRYYKSVKRTIYENKYANHYLTDVEFKTNINLHRSLLINLVYVIFNAVSAVVYHTHWFGIFAVYYAIMVVMRFLLVRYVSKNYIGKSRLGELKRSRFCAYILLTVNLALSAVVLMMIYMKRGFEYQGFLIYVMAMYTFYITSTAIKDLIKYRKYKSPVMSMSNAIKLASSLFSMLFLETAMFAQFGADMSMENQRIMIMATGAGIAVIVVTMAVYTIVRSTTEIKEIKRSAAG